LTSRRFYYGWTIVAVAFLSLGTWLAMRTTFAIFLMALLDEFHWSRAAAAGVQSVSFIVYTCSAPFVGMLIDRLGPRRVIPPGIVILCAGLLLSGRVHSLAQLYLVYGGIAAFGVTFISISPYSAVLSRWFQKKRGLASGVAVSGMGVGTFVFVPLTQYVIGCAGWRTAFTVLSGCVFLLLFPITVMLMRRNPQEMGLEVDGGGDAAGKRRGVEVVDAAWADTDWTLKKAARQGRFWSLLAFPFLVIAPIYVILIHGPKLLADSGFARMDVAVMFAIMGVTTSVFQICWGWLSDTIGREAAFSLGVSILTAAILLLIAVEGGSSRATAYCFIILFGVGWGVTAPMFMAIAADLFQGKSFGLIYGVVEATIGAGCALGPWAGGLIFDMTGSYRVALLAAAAACAASCPFAWAAAPRKVRRRRPAG
jgi:MFS family permease